MKKIFPQVKHMLALILSVSCLLTAMPVGNALLASAQQTQNAREYVILDFDPNRVTESEGGSLTPQMMNFSVNQTAYKAVEDNDSIIRIDFTGKSLSNTAVINSGISCLSSPVGYIPRSCIYRACPPRCRRRCRCRCTAPSGGWSRCRSCAPLMP